MIGCAGRVGWLRGRRPPQLLVLVLVLVLVGCRDHHADRRAESPPPAPRYLLPAPTALPPAPSPARTLGRGPAPDYPRPIRLELAPGVDAPDPPLRVRVVRAVEGTGLAVASGFIGDSWSAMRIDLERNRVDWVSSVICPGPVVAVTAHRVVCAGGVAMVALDLENGHEVWRSPLRYRAATDDRLLAIDEGGVGHLLAIADGARLGRVVAPAREPLVEVHRMCAATPDGGAGAAEDAATATALDLYAWSPAGRLRRLRVGADGAAHLAWSVGAGHTPTQIDVCQPELLVEVPIPGSSLRILTAIDAASGAIVGGPIQVYGWWPARGGPGVETSGDDGITLRTRALTPIRVLIPQPIGTRPVAAVGDDRLIRAHGGTLVRLAGDGSVTWLAAPAVVDDAVITADRLLAGAWLVPPMTRAEYPTLFELPPPPAIDAPPRLPPSLPVAAPLGDRVAVQKLGSPVVWRPDAAIDYPDAGHHAVSRPVLDGTALYMATLERRPGPRYGAGLAGFDLATRRFTWHRDRVCAANATVIGVAVAGPVVVCGAAENEPGPAHLSAVARATGEPRWQRSLPNLDALAGAGEVLIASHGDRAEVLRAADGQTLFQLVSDNRHTPRVVAMVTAAKGQASRTLVVAVEAGGTVVARDPARGGAPVWAVAVRGYVVRLLPAGDRVALALLDGQLYLLDPADGSAVEVAASAPWWQVPGGGDLELAEPAAAPGVSGLAGFGLDGAQRFRAGFAIAPPLGLAALRGVGESPVVAVTYRGMSRALVLDAGSGRLTGVYELSPRHVRGGVFGAIVAGRPVAGAVLQKPAGVVFF